MLASKCRQYKQETFWVSMNAARRIVCMNEVTLKDIIRPSTIMVYIAKSNGDVEERRMNMGAYAVAVQTSSEHEKD